MPQRSNITAFTAFMGLALAATPARAQDDPLPEGREGTVYEGDWLSVGVGLGYGPTYDGSDDYVVIPIPLVQGELGGIGISPRPAGIALDFVPNPEDGVGFNFGPSIRLRANRALSIKDPVVESLGKLKKSIELGPAVGITIPKVLHGYDSLSLSVDTRWDILGASNGMIVDPAITYFSPLSRGTAVSLTVNAEHGDGDFMRYYYSVSPDQSAASGLSAFEADAGWTRASVLLLGGVDFDGDLANGGFAIFALVNYTRMLGDAAASPFTSERGSANQWLTAIGIGKTF